MRLKAHESVLLLVDVQEKLFPHIEGNVSLEKHLIALVQGLKTLDVPILCNQQYTQGLGETIASLKALLESKPTYEKKTFSCCLNESLIEALEGLNRKSVILAGIETHICVLQTALDLRERGFDVMLCCDAMGSRKKANHELALSRMQTQGAILGSTESILFELLGSAQHPEFKTISKSVREL